MPPSTLAEFISPFSHVRLAEREEGPALAQFLNKQFMSTSTAAITFDRSPDFFSLLEVYSPQVWCFVFLNDSGTMAGLASLSRKEHFVNGEPRWVGYLGDLRLSPKADRNIQIQWRDFYQKLVAYLESQEAQEHCSHLVTAVFKDNLRALNIFKKKLKGLQYHRIGSYWNFALLHPFRLRKTRTNLKIQRVQKNKIMQNYKLQIQNMNLLPTNYPETSGIENLAVGDSKDSISLTAALWDSSSYRNLRLDGISLRKKILLYLVGKFAGVSFSTNQAWKLKFLTYIYPAKDLPTSIMVSALTLLIENIFAKPHREFQLLILPLTNLTVVQSLAQIYPLHQLQSGEIFEVTSKDKKPALIDSEIQFEAAFL